MGNGATLYFVFLCSKTGYAIADMLFGYKIPSCKLTITLIKK